MIHKILKLSQIFLRLASMPTTPAEAANILGVNIKATDEEINKAYRPLAAKYHPDKNNGDDQKFKELGAAKDLLLKTPIDKRDLNTGSNQSKGSGLDVDVSGRDLLTDDEKEVIRGRGPYAHYGDKAMDAMISDEYSREGYTPEQSYLHSIRNEVEGLHYLLNWFKNECKDEDEEGYEDEHAGKRIKNAWLAIYRCALFLIDEYKYWRKYNWNSDEARSVETPPDMCQDIVITFRSEIQDILEGEGLVTEQEMASYMDAMRKLSTCFKLS